MILLGQTHLLEHKGAILNTSDSTLTFNGKKLELSKNDYKILHILLENKGKIVSRDIDDGQGFGKQMTLLMIIH